MASGPAGTSTGTLTAQVGARESSGGRSRQEWPALAGYPSRPSGFRHIHSVKRKTVVAGSAV